MTESTCDADALVPRDLMRACTSHHLGVVIKVSHYAQ